MNKKIVLSADIIASTSLDNNEKIDLLKKINGFIKLIEKKFNLFGRVIKGDYIEIVLENPSDGLTIMLLLKSYIKSISASMKSDDARFKLFKNHGIRIAMGYGTLKTVDIKNGVIDGEAIYFSGRKINEESTTYNKERIVIKNTLFFVSQDDNLDMNINAILSLIDLIITKATAKQCEILYYKLLEYNEDEIAKALKIKQPAINVHSTSVGWNAIEKSIKYFEHLIK